MPRAEAQFVPETFAELAAYRTLIQSLAHGEPLTQILERIAIGVESCTEGLMASVLLAEGTRLRFAAGPSLPPDYNRAADGVPIGEGFGSCGTAAFRRQLVVATDIQADPLWKNYREIARRYSLDACWSTPIVTPGGEVLGTFALYYTAPRSPQPDELLLIERFSQLALLAIERHRLAQALAASEKSARDLAAELDVVVAEADPGSGRFVRISANAQAIFGHPIERWLGEPELWPELLHPEDRELTLRRRQQAIRALRNEELEYRLYAADGRVVWVRELIRFAPDGPRQAHVLRCLLLNLTRQREAEQAREQAVHQLSIERTLLRASVEHIPDGFIVVGAPNGEVLAANARFEQIIGLSMTARELFPQHVWGQGFHPDGRAYSAGEWPAMRVLAGEALREEMELVRSDGARVSLEVHAAPLRGADGRILAGVVRLADVTERKLDAQRQAALTDASEQVVGSLEATAAAQGVALVAVREFATWCLVLGRTSSGDVKTIAFEHRDANKAGLGASFGRLAGQPGGSPLGLSVVLASGRAQLFRDITLDAFEPGAVQPALASLLRDLGTASAMTIALQTRGQVGGAMLFGLADGPRRYSPVDLSVAEEIGRRLGMALDNARLYEEGRAAIRRRDQFLAIAAHELRTPLTSLKLKLQTLLVELGDDGSAEQRRIRDRVRGADRQSERLARLVEELLDVSSIYAERLPLRKQDLDLATLVQAVVGRFEEEVAAKRLDLTVHTAAPVMGYWDRLRIEQVCANLISNAIKYGAGRPIRIAVEGDANHARVSVEDEGIGMTPEVIERILQPFERGVATGEYSGLGLGLYISDQIVRAHGGVLIVRSTPGRGSTFTVELPRRS